MLVDADREVAFTVFTERIGVWWPLGEQSVHGDGATVAFVEPASARGSWSRAGAEDAVWGRVTRWEPGALIAFTWHPGSRPRPASTVTVTFEDQDGKTLVALEHTGWEGFGDRRPRRATSTARAGGRPGRVRRAVRVRMSGRETPGWRCCTRPADPSVAGGVFADPRFGDHVAFLQRMAEAGYLVAAGSFADVPARG